MKQGSILAFLQPQFPTRLSIHAGLSAREQAEQEVVDVGLPKDSVGMHLNSKSAIVHATTPIRSTLISDVTRKRVLDPRVAISKVSESHIFRLKQITSTLLRVRYSEKFFSECIDLDNHSVVALVATYDGKTVGWIRCCVEPFPNKENEAYQQLYIQALGLLAPYRGLGIATELLRCATEISYVLTSELRSVYAHVWESNEDGLEWYDKQSFRRIMMQPQYYHRLKPSGAWIVRKELT